MLVFALQNLKKNHALTVGLSINREIRAFSKMVGNTWNYWEILGITGKEAKHLEEQLKQLQMLVSSGVPFSYIQTMCWNLTKSKSRRDLTKL